MPDHTRLVRDYLEALHSGRLARARELLADDLVYHDPMMTARDADDLIRQVEGFGGAANTEIREVVGQGDVVAALTTFRPPQAPAIPFSQWFRIGDGRITSIQVIYDPRPFLEMMEG